MLIKHQRLEAFVAGGLRILTILEAGETNAASTLDTLLDGLGAHVGSPQCCVLVVFFLVLGGEEWGGGGQKYIYIYMYQYISYNNRILINKSIMYE